MADVRVNQLARDLERRVRDADLVRVRARVRVWALGLGLG